MKDIQVKLATNKLSITNVLSKTFFKWLKCIRNYNLCLKYLHKCLQTTVKWNVQCWFHRDMWNDAAP